MREQVIMISKWIIWGVWVALLLVVLIWGIANNYKGSTLPVCFAGGLGLGWLWDHKPKDNKD